jgi:hypothetical protein
MDGCKTKQDKELEYFYGGEKCLWCCFILFFYLAMDQMITFNTSLHSEKKTLPD